MFQLLYKNKSKNFDTSFQKTYWVAPQQISRRKTMHPNRITYLNQKTRQF